VTPPRVETAAGWIEGDRVAGPDGTPVDRFLGVPYAAPPVGDRRWRAPVPPEPWPGIRPARAFGPAAPQTAPAPSRLPAFHVADQDEDCLTANVWAPASTPTSSGRRPVLVWLPGGAYLSGGPAMGVFDGARLAAEHDVVVVTVGSRLGALGYLQVDPTEDGAGDCGLRDQAAALAWVGAHAATFGGDPARVTVFGESAGGGSVLHLTALRDRPPFRRAIVQSGEPRTLAPDLARRVRDAFLTALDLDPAVPDVLAAARTRPVAAVLAAQDVVVATLAGPTGLMPFRPTFTDDLVDLDPIAAFAAGRARGVDLVIGTCRDELSLWPDPRARDLDDAGLRVLLDRLAGGRVDPDRILAAYRAERPDRSAAAVWSAARTDAVLRVPALRVADAHVAAGHRAFVHRFDWEAPGIGAAHAVDLPFTFGTFARDGWGAAVGADRRPVEAERLGRALRGAWCAVAATGTPEHPGLPEWPAYDPGRRPTLCFDATSRVVDDPAGAERAVWSD
jgi:para-nitrobenzyl esterase